MNALDYKTTDHRWGGRVFVLFLFCPRLRTKVKQKWTKQKNKRWTTWKCDNFATLLPIHHCDNCATVLRLGNSVTIVQQCGRIVTNILKVSVCVPIEYVLALFLLVLRSANSLAFSCAFIAYVPKTLLEARWWALAKRYPWPMKIICANWAYLARPVHRQILGHQCNGRWK